MRWQAVRIEVFAALVCVHIQAYPVFARFVSVVGVAYKGRWIGDDLLRQFVFSNHADDDMLGVRIGRCNCDLADQLCWLIHNRILFLMSSYIGGDLGASQI